MHCVFLIITGVCSSININSGSETRLMALMEQCCPILAPKSRKFMQKASVPERNILVASFANRSTRSTTLERPIDLSPHRFHPQISFPTEKRREALLKNAVKLYLHFGGNTPNSKWIVSDKVTLYSFIKTPKIEESEDELVGGRADFDRILNMRFPDDESEREMRERILSLLTNRVGEDVVA